MNLWFISSHDGKIHDISKLALEHVGRVGLSQALEERSGILYQYKMKSLEE